MPLVRRCRLGASARFDHVRSGNKNAGLVIEGRRPFREHWRAYGACLSAPGFSPIIDLQSNWHSEGSECAPTRFIIIGKEQLLITGEWGTSVGLRTGGPAERFTLYRVPRPDASSMGGWSESLHLQVHKGELSNTMRRTYEWGFAQFVDWLDHQGAGEVTDALIRRWINGLRAQGHDSFSVNFWFDCVQSFFAWAEHSGRISHNPTNGIRASDLEPPLQPR